MMTAAWITLALFGSVLFLRQRLLFSPTAIFVGYFTLVVPIAYLVSLWLGSGSTFFSTPQDIPFDGLLAAFGLSAVCLLMFCAGRWLTPTVTLNWPQTPIIGWQVGLLAIISLAIATWAAFSLADRLADVDSGELRTGGLRGLGVQVYALTMVPATVMQFWLMCRLQSGRPAGLPLTMCVLTALLAGVFGFRGPVVGLIIQAIVIYALFTGRPTRRNALVTLALAVPLVTAVGYARFMLNPVIAEQMHEAEPAVVARLVADTAITRTRGVETIEVMKEHVDRNDFQYFLPTIRETLLAVVPSAIFPKESSVTEDIADEVYGDYMWWSGNRKDRYGGVAYTIVAEGYWNLGWLGTAIYAFVLGLLLSTIERRDTSQVTILQAIFYKAAAGSMLLIVEATQLGINSVLVNLLVNIMLFVSVTVSILPRRGRYFAQ